MDIDKIKQMYVKDQMSLREIATILGTNHKLISRIIKREGIDITKRNKRRVFTDEHRKKISEATKGRVGAWLGKKMPEEVNRKNMVAKLSRPSVTLEILNKYEDFERLKFLNGVIARHRKEFQSDEKYISYLDKFYYDKTFNTLYDNWINSGKNKWYMPYIDHINPKSKGGLYDLDNIQFLTWFENRAKAEMSQQEWDIFKKKTNTKSDLFI